MLAQAAFRRSISTQSGLNVLFFGSSSIAVPAFRALLESWQGVGTRPGLVKRLELVCPEPKVYQGKLKPVATRVMAEEHKIPIHDVPAELKTLKKWSPSFYKEGGFDVGVVASFGYILRPPQLEHFKLGALNIHPSLLPKYRGPCPLDHTLLNGDTTTGVTIIDVSAQVDSGAILTQSEAPVLPTDDVESLGARMGQLGARMMLNVLADYPTYKANSKHQDDRLASSAPMLSSDSGIVDWSLMTRVRLYNEWRARSYRGGLHTWLDTPRIPVIIRGVALPEANVRGGPPPTATDATKICIETRQKYEPGELYWDKAAGKLWVKCLDQWALITSLAVPKKAPAPVEQFVNGYHINAHGGRFISGRPEEKTNGTSTTATTTQTS